MKKPEKLRYKSRLLIYTSLSVFIIFSIVDYYCETVGLPDNIAQSLQEKIRSKGFDISFDDVKLGVIHGLVLTKPVLRQQYRNQNIFQAEKLIVGLTFSPVESYGFEISSFEIVQGHLRIPLFPEDGEEGENDLLDLDGFNAVVKFDDETIDIKHFQGNLVPFIFTASGTFNNLWMQGIGKDSYSAKKKERSFNFIALITKIPYLNRCRLYREILKFREGKFRTVKPECQIVFKIDVTNPFNSFIKADIESPAFSYGGFNIDKLFANMSVKGHIIDLSKVDIRLPSGGKINIKGKMDLLQNNVSGTADLHVLPFELNQIVQREKLNFPDYIQLGEQPMHIIAHVKDFSLTSMDFTGLLSVEIPQASIQKVPISDIKADLFINQAKITAQSFSMKTAISSLQGNFEYYPASKVFNLSAKTIGPPGLLQKAIFGDTKDLISDILNRFDYPQNPKDVELVIDLHAVFTDQPFYMLSANISMNDFKYNGVDFASGTTQIIIDSNSLLIIPAMTLQKDQSLATLLMVYDNSKTINYQVKSGFFSKSISQRDKFIAEIDGNLPGDDVLRCIFPEWKSEALNLSDPANIKANGVIDFSDMQKTLFKVKITDSSCRWQELPIKHLNCDLIFAGMDMEIKNAFGKIYNGDIELKYTYNFDSMEGTIDLAVDKADFAPIADYIGKELVSNQKGKLSLILKNKYYYDDKDNIFMDGKGKLWIRDADLWDIPIINEFGELTAKWMGKDWGNITKLDADLDFIKDHVYSDNIITDGTAISLRAKGSYYWNTHDFDYLIHADVLKSALPFNIVSNLFNPLSWLMETKVSRKGKDGKINWEKIRLFKSQSQ